jgi:pimeloyl-ACP methyl ester carboxylesterase
MDRLTVNGAELEVETAGEGEPLLLVHGGVLGDAFKPLLAEPALTRSYRVTHYHRRGFLGSSRAPVPFGIAQQAEDARAVLQQVCGGRAHVAGHSYGGVIALQLALDAPSAVHSLALLEPALVDVPAGEDFGKALGLLLAAYASGDKAAAIDGFLRAVLEDADYRSRFDGMLPDGWFDQAVADADTLFQVEFPALQDWAFTREMAARIPQPVLAVLGAESGPLFVQGYDRLKEWLPQAQPFVLPNATHGLQYMNPRGMAEGLAAFLARHPLPGGASAA